jgi:hypothetical protein
MNPFRDITRREWGWIFFLPLFLVLATFFSFTIFLPHYFIAITITAYAVSKFTTVFDRRRYVMFVVKVTALSIFLFAFLVYCNAIIGEVLLKRELL